MEDDGGPLLQRSSSLPMHVVPKVDVATSTVLVGKSLEEEVEELGRLRVANERLQRELEAKGSVCLWFSLFPCGFCLVVE